MLASRAGYVRRVGFKARCIREVKMESNAELGQRCRLGGLEQRDMRGVGVFHTTTMTQGGQGCECRNAWRLGPPFLEDEDLR
jgi:hypothetical protein